MKTLIVRMVILTLMLAVTVPVQAQAKKKQKKEKGQPNAISQVKKSLESVELTAEQQASLKEIFAKHQAPLAELQKARMELLGAEASKNMAAARKTASAAGKKGKELQAAALEAAGLSEEQTQELAELQKKTTAAATKLKTEVLALLTDEQKEASGITVRAGGKGKKKKAATN